MAEYIVQLPTEKVPLERMCFPVEKITGELIRCKDCFYGEVEPDDNSYFFCTHPLHKLESHESHYYCADGKRKEGR